MFSLNIHSLSENDPIQIDDKFDPSFLDLDEKEIKFKDPVEIKGKIYLASDDLIIDVSIKTYVTMPCSICNEQIKYLLVNKNYIHTQQLKTIKDAVYDYTEIIRQAVILELPTKVECNNNCPERENIAPYLKKKNNTIFSKLLGDK